LPESDPNEFKQFAEENYPEVAGIIKVQSRKAFDLGGEDEDVDFRDGEGGLGRRNFQISSEENSEKEDGELSPKFGEQRRRRSRSRGSSDSYDPLNPHSEPLSRNNSAGGMRRPGQLTQQQLYEANRIAWQNMYKGNPMMHPSRLAPYGMQRGGQASALARPLLNRMD